MDNKLRDYFAHPHIDLSYRKNVFKAAKFNPYYNFKGDFVFLPHYFDSLPSLSRCLILSHEAHHSADMHNVFFILLHYLNEIIGNFNYYVGSYLGRDRSGKLYTPPIHELSEEEWVYLSILTEGLPTFTRFNRYVNYLNATDSMNRDYLIDKNDEDLWQLQKNNVPTKSVYDYGIGLFAEINKKYHKLASKTDFRLLDNQVLLNNILGEDFYDEVMKSLGTIRASDPIGTVMNFITPPLYADVIRKLRRLDQSTFLDIATSEYSTQIQKKIISILVFLRDLFNVYKDGFRIWAKNNNATIEGVEVLDLYFIPMIEYEIGIQNTFLNTHLQDSPVDRTLLRYIISCGINTFCETPPYFRARDVNDILTDEACRVGNPEFLHEIGKLALDKYRERQVLMHLLLSAFRESHDLRFVDCPICDIFENIEKDKLSVFCEHFSIPSSDKKAFVNPGTCRYIKGVQTSDDSRCIFMLFAEMMESVSEKREPSD